jgi:tRNA (cytosine40_48-C5)-methyltransferase
MLVSGKGFFVERYRRLGWNFRDKTPRQSIRLNKTLAEGKRIPDRLRSNGVRLEKIPFLDFGYWVTESKVSIGATAEYLLGLYSIQEAAAQIPATLFSSLRQKLVLDACAAPGGKTIQTADLMSNTGVVIALDVNDRRLNALMNNLERCRISNTVVYMLDARKASKLKMKFDRILLDVPCSGNFATDENWFKRRTLNDVNRNAARQKEILSEAIHSLKDDGEIIYSTCSLEPEENELNMDWAVEKLGLRIEEVDCFGQDGVVDVFGKQLDPSVKHCKRIWPGQTQGFFVSKLKKEPSA